MSGNATQRRYFEGFSSWEVMRDAFVDHGPFNYETREYDKATPPEAFPADDDVLFAAYGGGAYEGDAIVVFRGTDGRLMLATAGHCSCNGLEGSWGATATSADALGMMDLSGHSYEAETLAAFRTLWPKPVTP